MGKLNDMFAWGKTTVVDLVEEAEGLSDDQFDVIELGMNNGRTIAIAVISGPRTEEITERLRALAQGD